MLCYLVLLFFSFSFANLITTYKTVSIDGNSTDWDITERIYASNGTYLFITWDLNQLYVATELVQRKDNSSFVLYIDTDPHGNTFSGNGTNIGAFINRFNAKQFLPFYADFTSIINADGSDAQLFSFDGFEFVLQDSLNSSINTNFIEFSIPWSLLGFPSRIFVCSCIVDSFGTSSVAPVTITSIIDTSINATITDYIGLLITEYFVPYHVMNVNALPVNANGTVSTWTSADWLPEPPTVTSNVFIKSNTKLVLDINTNVKGIAVLINGTFEGSSASNKISASRYIANFGGNFTSSVDVQTNVSIVGDSLSSKTEVLNLMLNSWLEIKIPLEVVDNFTIIMGGVYGDFFPMYLPNSKLVYSTNGNFLIGEEWTNSPFSVLISQNTFLTLSTTNQKTIQSDLTIESGTTLDLSSHQGVFTVQGIIFNSGTLSLSTLTSLSSGNYVDLGGILYRNGNSYLCPIFQFNLQNATCGQNNGFVDIQVLNETFTISSISVFPGGFLGPNVTGLGIGTYNVNITEIGASGCPNGKFTIYNICLTSGDLTSGDLTSELVTTSHVTSAQLTSSPVTSGFITSGHLTSGRVTSGHVTTGRVHRVTTSIAAVGTTGEESSTSNSKTVLIVVIVIVVAVNLGACAVLFTFCYVKRKQIFPKRTSVIDLPEISEVFYDSHSLQFHSVKGVGISYDKNQYWRPTMEDEHVAIDRYGGFDKGAYFAVYDGHGGKETATFIKEHLHKDIITELHHCKEFSPEAPDDKIKHEKIEQAITCAFLKTDEKVCKQPFSRAGSTAISIALIPKGDKVMLYSANAGDARAVLRREGKGIRLSFDHKASDEGEAERIKNNSGFILMNKVAGILAVTRSFGDAELKQWVTAEPFIFTTELSEQDTHIIVACDGLWDVCDDQKAADIVASCKDAEEASKALLKYALDNRTRDNVSIIVVFL